MKRLLIMLVLSVAAVVACGPSGSSSSPAATTAPDATTPAVESPSLPTASESPARNGHRSDAGSRLRGGPGVFGARRARDPRQLCAVRGG